MGDYLPGTASLIPYIDKKLMVVLRDQRTLIGYLRTIDQFANLVLHKTIERIHVEKKFGDIDRGIFLIRGENVVLLGEIDEERDLSEKLQEVPVEEIFELQREQLQKKEEERERRKRALQERGIRVDFEHGPDPFS